MSDLVDRLLASMTLEEKLGQLNMIDAGMPPDGSQAGGSTGWTSLVGGVSGMVQFS